MNAPEPSGAPDMRHMPCPACGSMESRLWLSADDYMLGIAGPFFVSRCAACGLAFQNPRIAPECLPRHYPDDYGPYVPRSLAPDAATRGTLRRRHGYAHLDVSPPVSPWKRMRGGIAVETLLIPDYVPGGRLLEIACASGDRLALLRDLGWTDCAGVEWSEAAAHRARARGFSVTRGKAEDALERIPDASLDAVIAGFVMEHLEDPFGFTARLAAKLKPGGQLLFSTLTLGSPDFRIYGKYWYDLDLPRHMTLFRMRDLRRMLDGHFRVERLTRIAAPQDWFGSARYRARHESHPLDRLLIAAGNRLRPASSLLALCGLAARVAVRCVKPGR